MLKYFAFEYERKSWKNKYYIISEYFLPLAPSLHFSQRQKCITGRIWLAHREGETNYNTCCGSQEHLRTKSDIIQKRRLIAQCQTRVLEGIFFSKEFQYSVLSFKLKTREMFKVLNFLEEKKNAQVKK